MIIADANLVIYFLLENEQTAAAEAVRKRDPDWHAPRLIELELISTLAGYVKRGDFNADLACRHLQRGRSLVRLHDVATDAHRLFRLMMSTGCTAYDLQYVLLAESLDAPLVTADREVLKAFPTIAVEPGTFG